MVFEDYLVRAKDLSNSSDGRNAVIRLAELILADYKSRTCTNRPPYNPKRAAEYYGMVVKLADLKDSSGKLLFEEDRTTILLNRGDTSFRRRFTCAHELAHFFLRSHSVNKARMATIRKQDIVEEEKRANIFASNFLMPEEDVIAAFRQEDSQKTAEEVAEKLAGLFSVHLLTILYRLSEFELPIKPWFFLILKYMSHPTAIRPGGKGPEPKLRVLRSTRTEHLYIPQYQGADTLGLTIGDIPPEKVKNIQSFGSIETVMIKILFKTDKVKWVNARAICEVRYRGAASPAIGPAILGFCTIKSIKPAVEGHYLAT